MTRLVVSMLTLALGLVHAQDTGGAEGGASPSETANLVATAEITDANGNVIGDANFTTGVDDSSFVTVQIGLSEGSGLAPGEHGVHIHEVGECSVPDFESAGAHYNPTGAQHGLLNPEGPHAGDLPNLTVNENGTVDYLVTSALVTVNGERTLFDDDGSALIIHEGADDYVTDSSGNSGGRVACGVITQP